METAAIGKKDGRFIRDILNQKHFKHLKYKFIIEGFPPWLLIRLPLNSIQIKDDQESVFGFCHFATNGAKIHYDTGVHLEYATPEGFGPHFAAQYEKEGERTLAEAVAGANQKWEGDGLSLRLFKNNLDILGNSYGNHESYLVVRNSKITSFSKLVDTLLSFFASRHLFVGSGWITFLSSGKPCFNLSQRARVITDISSGSTVKGRGIINTKDEVLADKEKYLRLHIIIGDGVMAESAMLLKYGATSMMLELVETGFLDQDPCFLAYPIDAMRHLNKDSTLKNTISTIDGPLNIIDIQEKNLEKAEEYFFTERKPDKLEKKILALWRLVVDRARASRPHEALAPYIDWAAKKLFCEKDLIKRGYGLDVKRDMKIVVGKKERTAEHHLKAIDFQFGELAPTGIMNVLAGKGELKREIADTEVGAYTRAPAANTRAYPRHLSLVGINERINAGDKILSLSGDWTHVIFNGCTVFKCLDPYEVHPAVPSSKPPREGPTVNYSEW